MSDGVQETTKDETFVNESQDKVKPPTPPDEVSVPTEGLRLPVPAEIALTYPPVIPDGAGMLTEVESLCSSFIVLSTFAVAVTENR